MSRWLSREMIPVGLAIALPPLLFAGLEAGVDGARLDARTPPPEVVARIGERQVTLAEMDRAIRLRVQKEKDKYRSDWLDRQVLEHEAAARGLDVRELVKQEVHSKIDISQAEVDRRWEQIKGRLKPGTTRADVEGDIRNELGQRRAEPALRAYVAELKVRYGTSFQPPLSERFALDPNPRGGPAVGSLDAPVTVIEFSDLECSYCAQAHARVQYLVKRRPDDVRVVYRHLPLPNHKHARLAAEVAACAQGQGLFWALADSLFRNQRNLESEQIRTYAEQVGLDMARVDACLASGESERLVEADIEEARALGVTSTPTFFVNGDYVGSLPKGGLEQIVDRELARLGRK